MKSKNDYLKRFERPKKIISSGFRPNKKGALPHYSKHGHLITNQKGAFGS